MVKVGRGIYIRKDLPMDTELQIRLAMKRVPHGVAYLESALMFHGVSPRRSGSLCFSWVRLDSAQRLRSETFFAMCITSARSSGRIRARAFRNLKR